jgi:hypothetical protein
MKGDHDKADDIRVDEGYQGDWISFCVDNVAEQPGMSHARDKLFFKYFKKNIYKINLKCIFVLEYDHTSII